MTSRRLAVIGSVALAAGLVAGLTVPAGAQQGTADDAEQALAERFAPVVALVTQKVCDAVLASAQSGKWETIEQA
jgi:hypothetical protein